jgi:hypothetical protein
MKRLAAAILLTIFAATATATENYQDWWWNPSLSGMGWNVGQQDNTITVAWYLYDSTENPIFLTLSGQLVGNAVEGILFESFGPPPGPGYNPADVDSIAVGTARVVFQAGNQATFTYDYDGLAGTITLERFSYDFEDFSGEWIYAATGVSSGCTISSNNGAYTSNGRLSINQNGSFLSVRDSLSTGGTCTYNVTLSQKGSYYDGSGAFSCDYGVSGMVTISDTRRIDDFLILVYDAQTTSGESCRQQSEVAGVKD